MKKKLFLACAVMVSASILSPMVSASKLSPKAQTFVAGTFTVKSDTSKDVEFTQFQGSCKALADYVKNQNDSSLMGKVRNIINDAKNTSDCNADKAILIKGGSKEVFTVAPGQWVIGFKKGFLNPESYVPAVCFANPNKTGRTLRFYTPKSETARSLFGKSMGFGLVCEQIED